MRRSFKEGSLSDHFGDFHSWRARFGRSKLRRLEKLANCDGGGGGATKGAIDKAAFAWHR